MVNTLVRNHSTIVEAVVGGKIVAASQILFLAAAPARSNPEKFRPVSCPRMRIDLVVRFRVTGSSHRTTGTTITGTTTSIKFRSIFRI